MASIDTTLKDIRTRVTKLENQVSSYEHLDKDSVIEQLNQIKTLLEGKSLSE